MTSLKDQAIYTALNGEWGKAISLNKSLIKENPEDVNALNRLAFALSILGKTKDAKSTYQKVLKIDSLNPLALRNLKQISKGKKFKNSVRRDAVCTQVNNTFLEESGKTKVVGLVNIAQPQIINSLCAGQLLTLSVKRLKIFLLTEQTQYIGMLPDNIGKRLIKFLKAGNEYQAFVKSASDRHLSVFIKEVKRISRFKDQPSFVLGETKGLRLDKKINYRYANSGKREEDNYDGDDEDEED